MRKTLRPYQQEVVDKVKKRWRETAHPLLITASVGAGKSLVIAELLLFCARAGYRSLCLTMNSTLVQQNAHTYELQDRHAGIYSAGLKSKSFEESVIFGTPHSILQGIRNKEQISRQKFHLIIIDECHQIAQHNPSSMFMNILNHYGRMAQEEQYSFRIVGLTGTPYRDKNTSIFGNDKLFKEEIANISTHWLIDNGYLTKPEFGLTKTEQIDFSQCAVDQFGRFNKNDLTKSILKDERLTGKIMRELVSVIENGRKGAFIFAATKNHCMECARSLPAGQWAIVTGDTPHQERIKILEDAKNGVIKYLINVNVLTTGVDLPLFDVCAWLRPTESLILFIQGIGRVLRLHPEKETALILDYAGNLDRHADIDDPIINEALQTKIGEKEEDYPFMCYTCNTTNSIHARRCRGVINNKRCEYYFEFKDCSQCNTQNDKTARACRNCNAELIDPNKKLTRAIKNTYTLNVVTAQYWVTPQGNTSNPIVHAKYNCKEGEAFETYFTSSEKSRTILYNNFVKQHVNNPSSLYRKMSNLYFMRQMVNSDDIKTPYQIECTKDEYGRFKLKRKMFYSHGD